MQVTDVKRFIGFALIVLLLWSCVSCDRNTTGEEANPSQENGLYVDINESQAFSSESVYFPDCDSIYSVELVDNDYYVITIDGLYEEFSDITWKVYKVDLLKNKELLYTATCERDSSLVKVISSEKLIQINGSELRVSDIDGNNPVLVNADLPGVNTVETECIDNLLYIGMQGRVLVYDLDGNLINTIDDDTLKTMDSLFEYNGNCYYSSVMGYTMDFFRLDAEESSIESICSSAELGIEGYKFAGNGNFFITPQSYEIGMVDLDSKRLISCSRPENMLVKPIMSGNDPDNLVVVLDPSHFASIRNYINLTKEVVFIEPDNDLDLSSRKKLIVGGTGFVNNRSFYIATYEFNKSQNDYTVVIDDYSELDIQADNPAEYQAELIKHFQSEGAPDIFFGPVFNYEYFYLNNMVIDMYPYMAADDQFVIDDMQPCIKDLLISDDNVCYQIMAGYYPIGYVGRSSYFNSPETSIYELDGLDPDRLYYGQEDSASLVNHVLLNSITDIYEDQDKDHSEQIEDLLNYSLLYADIQTGSNTIWVDEILNGDALLLNSMYILGLNEFRLFDSQCEDDMVYIGYPGINGSVHPAMPECLMAISSSAEDPEICWKFISYFFSDDLQRFMLYSINTRFPVMGDVFDEYLYYMKNPEEIPDEKAEYRYMTKFYPQISEDTLDEDIADYKLMVESVDCVVVYDYGINQIVKEEVNGLYSSDKTVAEIAESIDSRLHLYYEENYG